MTEKERKKETKKEKRKKGRKEERKGQGLGPMHIRLEQAPVFAIYLALRIHDRPIGSPRPIVSYSRRSPRLCPVMPWFHVKIKLF